MRLISYLGGMKTKTHKAEILFICKYILTYVKPMIPLLLTIYCYTDNSGRIGLIDGYERRKP